MSEYEETIKLAEHVLNRPNADPDDDLAMLSRQFLRLREYKAMGEELYSARLVVDAARMHVRLGGMARAQTLSDLIEAYDKVRGKGQADG